MGGCLSGVRLDGPGGLKKIPPESLGLREVPYALLSSWSVKHVASAYPLARAKREL